MMERSHIWSEADWPDFRWDKNVLADRLAAVRYKQGRFLGRMSSLGFDLSQEALLETLTADAVKSSEIEGEFLNPQSVRSSLARRLGIEQGGIGQMAPEDRNVEGIVDVVVDASENCWEPLTEERLFSWHGALFPTGRSGLQKIDVAQWRQGGMTVSSGPIGRERVHYTAPPPEAVPDEMRTFLEWFNRDTDEDPVLRAGKAHYWFVAIHPFDDGNGRITRALSDMMLARSDRSTKRFYSISASIKSFSDGYYGALERTSNGTLDITEWQSFFLDCVDRAIDQAEAALENVLERARFWEEHKDKGISDRQQRVLARLLDNFQGKMTTSKWAKIGKTSQDTAYRDINDLVEKGILMKSDAGGRSTSYEPVIPEANREKKKAMSTENMNEVDRVRAIILSDDEAAIKALSKADVAPLYEEIVSAAPEEEDELFDVLEGYIRKRHPEVGEDTISDWCDRYSRAVDVYNGQFLTTAEREARDEAEYRAGDPDYLGQLAEQAFIEQEEARIHDAREAASEALSYEAGIERAEAEGIARAEEGEHMKHDDFGNHIAADRADKWFDLSQFDARIDRLPVDEMSSGYFLRLELPAEHPAPSVDDLSELGWVKTGQEGGRVTFENAQSASSASAVLEKLGAFFDADDLRTRYKPLRDHVEPPKVFGLKPQRSDIVLSQLVEGVDLADKTRMRNTMALCLGKAATMRQQQENALFAGNGTAMFHHLTSNLVNRSENPWREIEASAYVRSVMEAAGRNPNDQAARMMASLGEALRDRDTASVDELTDGLLRPTETYSADAAETHPDLDNGIRKAIYRNVEFAERAGNQVSATAIAIGQMRGAAYLPAHSMTSDTSITRQNAAEVIEEVRMQLPFDVRLDGSTPTMQAAQSLKAINKALNVAAEALGRAPERILRDNKARFLRLSNENVSPDKGVVGYQAALKTEDDDVIQAITSSARSGRSFIHELGHAVDFSWGFNDAEREACLSRSGVTGAIHDEIDRRFPTEEIEARSYYRDPKEMFARMFDAHVCNVARANGDMDLSSIGGAHTTCGYDIGAPHGNIEATSAFFDEVRATIERKLDAENKAALESTKAASAGVAAPGR